MNGDMFIKQLDTALYMIEIRKKLIDQSSKKDKEDFPGSLESENKWKEWGSEFIKIFFHTNCS